MLDTCVCVDLLRRREYVLDKVKEVGVKNCSVSEITLAELYYGAAKSGQERHFNDVALIQQMFQIVPCFNSLRLFGEQRVLLEKAGNCIDDFDLMIGVSAISNKMVMVTDNTKHFERISDIVLENWKK